MVDVYLSSLEHFQIAFVFNLSDEFRRRALTAGSLSQSSEINKSFSILIQMGYFYQACSVKMARYMSHFRVLVDGIKANSRSMRTPSISRHLDLALGQ